MDASEASSALSPLSQPTKVPIAQLSPTLEQLEGKCIYATVTLVWPYSSSTKSLALLLAEPDIRLRRSNGQVKAVFHGRVAEKVAGSLVGIGDHVRLALKGSNLVENNTAAQTPSRSVAWDIHFKRNVSLEVDRTSRNQSVVIIDEEPVGSPPSTPQVTSIESQDTTNGPGAWGSPAFLRTARYSYGEALDSYYDPFAEKDGFVPGRGRKRPRYSLRREEWRILDEPSSPREREGTVDWDKVIEDEMNLDQDAESQMDTQLPTETSAPDVQASENTSNDDPFLDHSDLFAKPSLEPAGGLFGRRALASNEATTGGIFDSSLSAPAFHLPTDTPQLRPVPSPGLPIPSPIVSNQNNAQGYFSPFQAVPQAQNAQSLSADVNIDTTNDLQTQTMSTDAAEVENKEHDRDMGPDQDAIIAHHYRSELPGYPDLQNNDEVATEAMRLPCPPSPEFVDQQEVDKSHDGFQYMDDTQQRLEENLHDRPVEEDDLDGLFENENGDIEAVHVDEQGFVAPESSPEMQDIDDIHMHRRVDMDFVEEETEEHVPGTEDMESEDENQETRQEIEHSERQSHASEEKSDAHEAIYSGFDKTDDISETDSDDEDQDKYTGEDEEEASQAEDLPRPQSTQQEVIVLDSDSEDELTSDQPAMPTPALAMAQGSRADFSSPVQRTLSSLVRVDSEDDWSAAEEEAGYDDMEDAEAESNYDEDDHVDDNDRVADSDLENDESSVDILARDHHKDQQSTRDASLERGQGGVGVAESALDAHTDAQTAVEDNIEDDFGTVEEPEPIVGVDSNANAEKDQDEDVIENGDVVENEDTAEDEGEIEFKVEDKGERSQEGIQNPSEPESESESLYQDHGGRLTSDGLDGAGDGNTPSPSSFYEPYQLAANETEATEARTEQFQQNPQDAVLSEAPLEPDLSKTLEQQLPTPDPTQEPFLGSEVEPINVRNAACPSSIFGTHAPPMGQNITYQRAPDASIEVAEDVSDDAPDEDEDNLRSKQPDSERQTPDVASRDATPQSPEVSIPSREAPDRYAQGFRSKLSYFAPLASLVEYYNSLVDTVSIVHKTSPISKATGGSKDFFVTIQLTDPSLAGTTLQAQIFRRNKSAMPSIIPGSAILLRDFKVRTYDHEFMLVSVQSSAWAVFDHTGSEPEMNGPPVEYTSEEADYASGLRRWYADVGTRWVADYELQAAIARDSYVDREHTPGSAIISETGSMDSGSRENSAQSSRRRSRKNYRQVTIHELRDGFRYAEVGSPSTRESIHELRDGTVYATPAR
ncbi:hypothetical protein N7532_006644 [Penicillium argentinense]|uniref:Telomeric single stranded DNA binding POT1/Cdc13 domain-containing protein n=1 Tax=Penicillium argentinense TaxID=1131581 RepID=A0A9W9KB41_9EURO|nr:uncharacterized protein N7532_006644 [Penicillium argentinense]KAJ5099643.1 hypothetical protein N7532_006644 [Penicillium argentinense]